MTIWSRRVQWIVNNCPAARYFGRCWIWRKQIKLTIGRKKGGGWGGDSIDLHTYCIRRRTQKRNRSKVSTGVHFEVRRAKGGTAYLICRTTELFSTDPQEGDTCGVPTGFLFLHIDFVSMGYWSGCAHLLRIESWSWFSPVGLSRGLVSSSVDGIWATVYVRVWNMFNVFVSLEHALILINISVLLTGGKPNKHNSIQIETILPLLYPSPPLCPSNHQKFKVQSVHLFVFCLVYSAWG